MGPWRGLRPCPQLCHPTNPSQGVSPQDPARKVAPSPCGTQARVPPTADCMLSPQANSSPRPLLLAGYEDGSVALWDVSEQKVCSRIACHTEPVMGLDVDSQKARGVSGSAEKALAVWSVDEQQALQVSGPDRGVIYPAMH